MLLQRTDLGDARIAKESKKDRNERPASDSEKPLTCMFYFFASQMHRNIQPADPDLVRRRKMADQPTHRLDTMVSRIGMHAAHSPLVKSFDTYPMDIPDAPGVYTSRHPKPPRDQVHDTVMLMKFQSKAARDQWIQTKEWQEFMRSTDAEQVFRRMPHVRCASSVRGLMDPMDVLTA